MKNTPKIILAVLALLLASTAHGQDEVSVSVRLSQQSAYVGEIIEYQIVVINANPKAEPQIDWPSGLQVSFSGKNTIKQQFSSLDSNGRKVLRTRNTTLMPFRVVALTAGSYTIPAGTLTVDGNRYDIEPVTITILEPPEAEDFDMVIELDRTSVFVGETLRLRVHWYLTSSVSEYSFRPSEKHESFEAFSEEDSTLQRRDRVYPIDIFGVRTIGRVRDATFRGERTRVLYFELLIRPTQAGEFDLGPIAVLFDRRTKRGTHSRTISRSEPLTITVKAPPTLGQPIGYSGLIGQFSLNIHAAPTTAHVGEPIDLTVTVHGDEPMTQVRTGPDLESIPGFTKDFRLSPDGWSREPSRSGQRVFSTKIRALSGEVNQIPPIRLPFFDPVLAEYQIATTPAIPLDIESVRTTTITDAIGSAVPTPDLPSIERAGPIFWAEDRGPDLLRREPVSVLAILRSPVWVSVAAIPPATYAVAFVVGAWVRKRDPELARRLARLRDAQHEATRGNPAAAAALAIEIAQLINPDAITSADAGRLSIDIEYRDCLANAVRTRETGFSESDQDAEPIDATKIARAIAAVREQLIQESKGARR